MNMEKTLVTGAAGFIGYHVAERLLSEGHAVVGVDNLNPYYDPRLKRARLARLARHTRFEFKHLDLAERRAAEALFENHQFNVVVHLAAQAGVRYLIENPHAYVESNITGFLNVLEGSRRVGARHLLYASSSSVYGGTKDRCDQPISLYAATKRANELMAHSYTHLFGVPTTGLRFFTVYGPWGRPDMAPFRFAQAIERGERIDIYNYGRMQRDFTYVDDAAEAVARLVEREPCGYRLFDIGAGDPVGLMEFVHTLEDALGKRACKRFLPMQKGDVAATRADVEALYHATGYRPSTPLQTGVDRFVSWYRDWHLRHEVQSISQRVSPHNVAAARL